METKIDQVSMIEYPCSIMAQLRLDSNWSMTFRWIIDKAPLRWIIHCVLVKISEVIKCPTTSHLTTYVHDIGLLRRSDSEELTSTNEALRQGLQPPPISTS
jgi:hypothetical protein